MKKLDIRKAVLDDAPAIASVHSRSWLAAYTGIIPDETIAQKNTQRLEQWANNLSGESRHTCYAAVLDDRVAGFCSVAPAECEGYAGWFEVCAIYLDPDCFRQGIGRCLMDFALGLAREGNYPGVTVSVLEENTPARRFYEACGFAWDGQRSHCHYGRELVSIRYAMRL